jgi:hypothetical protein
VTTSEPHDAAEAAELKRRLREFFATLRGEIRIGGLILEMQADYGAVLDALDELEAEGVVISDPNAGSFFPAHLVPADDEDED